MILYFAYGSNMLSARLRERCPSASPLGRASAPGYRLTFDKLGRDGSGKATIVPGDPDRRLNGVLYHISRTELPALDDAEWGYIRRDDFSVVASEGLAALEAITYIAPPKICREGLFPFDWYLELIRAGHREHGGSDEQVGSLSDIPVIEDDDRDRSARMFSLCAKRDKG